MDLLGIHLDLEHHLLHIRIARHTGYYYLQQSAAYLQQTGLRYGRRWQLGTQAMAAVATTAIA